MTLEILQLRSSSGFVSVFGGVIVKYQGIDSSGAEWPQPGLGAGSVRPGLVAIWRPAPVCY